MSILTLADKAQFFSALELSDSELSSALARVQAIIEGPEGAHRPLGVQKFVDTPFMDGDGIAQLSRLPIVNDGTMTVQARGLTQNAPFGLTATVNQFIDLARNQEWTLDADLGEVQLSSTAFLTYSGNAYATNQASGTRIPYAARRHSRTRPANQQPQLKVIYETGFDFCDITNPIVQSLKAAAASVLGWVTGSNYEGIERVRVDRRVEVQFQKGGSSSAGGAAPGSVPESMLMVFRQYRPRSYSI